LLSEKCFFDARNLVEVVRCANSILLITHFVFLLSNFAKIFARNFSGGRARGSEIFRWRALDSSQVEHR